MSLHYVFTNEPCTNTSSITNTTGAPNYMKLKDTILNTMSWKPIINMKGSILPSGDDVLVHDICKYIPSMLAKYTVPNKITTVPIFSPNILFQNEYFIEPRKYYT